MNTKFVENIGNFSSISEPVAGLTIKLNNVYEIKSYTFTHQPGY